MSECPPGYSFCICRAGWKTWRIFSSLLMEGMTPEQAFSFFEDPRNLFTITPPWMDFRMLDPDRSKTGEGAEFDYTIRWLGIRIHWKSRLVNYHPPKEFTDIQLSGPYLRWEHRHSFENRDKGTLMRDEVDYVLPAVAVPLHPLLIRRQLGNIFRYRAMRIEEWARGALVYRQP